MNDLVARARARPLTDDRRAMTDCGRIFAGFGCMRGCSGEREFEEQRAVWRECAGELAGNVAEIILYVIFMNT